MIGYRYISDNDWAQFQKDGYIAPRPITDWTVLSALEVKSLKGIWIWKKRLKRKAHIGAVLHQALQKKSMIVYLLEINYKENWTVRPSDHMLGDPRELRITHHGNLGKWKHWACGAQIALIKKRIYKKDVRLIEKFDLIQKLWLESKSRKNN